MKIQLETASIEFAHNYFERHETNNYKALKQGFQEGAKWQQEQDKKMYSEEDMINRTQVVFELTNKGYSIDEIIEQFKSK
jgi:hypothetical protein